MLKNLWQTIAYNCIDFFTNIFFFCTGQQNKYYASVASHTSTVYSIFSMACCVKNRKYKSAAQVKPQQKKGSRANYYLFYTTVCLLLFASCKKADITFGEALLDNAHTQIIKVDTVSIDASTVYVDSFVTNNKGMGLVGVYNDPFFGLIRAKSYVEIAPPTFEDSFQQSTFDSLEIVLFLNKNYYGDTTKPVSLNIYRLFKNLGYVDNSNMYNNSNFSLYSTPIGEHTFMLMPNQMDSISIRLSDDLGKSWLTMLQHGNSYMTAPSTFRDYFKGFCIQASGDDGLVFGFSDSISVRLHYTQQELYPTSKQVVFNIFNRGYQFNNISIDRTGSAINKINSSNKEISTTQTNNIGYMQYITGTMVKLRFPYLRDILQLNGYTSLAGAELRVRPVASSFNNIYSLPTTLRLATTDGNNQLLTNITSLNSSTNVETVQDGSLQIDGLYGVNTYYSYDVTDYIKYLLGVTENNKYGLLVAPLADNVATTFNRLLLQDNKNESYRTEFILYYLSVQ